MKRTLINYYFDAENMMPCPFCGANANDRPLLTEYRAKGFDEFFSVACQCCGAESCNYDKTAEKAILHWNTRAVLSSSDEFKLGYESAKRDFLQAIYQLKDTNEATASLPS